eukprot:5599336-Karenia_brevis.AAC.1
MFACPLPSYVRVTWKNNLTADASLQKQALGEQHAKTTSSFGSQASKSKRIMHALAGTKMSACVQAMDLNRLHAKILCWTATAPL